MSRETVKFEEPQEWVNSAKGEELFGGKQEHGAFFYYVRKGRIRTIPAPEGKKGTLYNTEDILRAKQERDKKKPTPMLEGETDWVQERDLPYLLALDLEMYGLENTVDISITGKWWQKNPTACRILFNKENRKEIWGAITIMPLDEEVIFKLLRDEMQERDIKAEQVHSYSQGGAFYGYVASALIHPEHRRHFRKLVDSIFTFWCEQYPQVTLKKLYAFAASPEGEDLIKHLFFSPRYDLGDNAFELDPYRRSPSKILKAFQQCIAAKGAQVA